MGKDVWGEGRLSSEILAQAWCSGTVCWGGEGGSESEEQHIN